MWKVPLFDIGFDNEEIEAVQKVIRSGWLTMGDVTEVFERLFAEFLNVKHAIAVSSGTAALHLANLALGMGRGDEVICPSLTFVASANSIFYTGARPVFAEITSHDDFNISPDDITSRMTERTKAILVVHYGGHCCDMGRITEIAKRGGLFIIEDCAHAPGAEYSGKKCGALGDLGCFSFFSNKNMTTGEGGMITTSDDELAERIRLLRSHGMTIPTSDRYRGHGVSYNVVELGFNYRIDEMRSALGIVQMRKLKNNNNRRQELVQIYLDRLRNVNGLTIPFRNGLGLPAHHIFPILLDEDVLRSKFIRYLKDKGIQTSIHYPAIHQFDYYRDKVEYDAGCLSVTEEVAKREVTLPLYPSMKDEDVHYVCEAVAKYLQEGLD